MSKPKTHLRSIFISDLHLGSRGAQADVLSDFLSHHSSDNLYLVGDIVDLWALRRKAYFPTSHQTVVRKIIKRATNGTKVFYAPGNHDEAIRQFMPLVLDNIAVADEFVHEAADGKRYLVVHGDRYDQVVRYARWLAVLGDVGYSMLMRCNRYLNTVRGILGLGYWSLSAFVKARVKSAVSFIGEYETAVARSVRNQSLDGVICGHIHHAEMRTMEGITYINDGDWVESCTALVEHMDGTMKLIHWTVERPMAQAA